MLQISKLSTSQLRKQLHLLSLPTSGTKHELKTRLRNGWKARGIDIADDDRSFSDDTIRRYPAYERFSRNDSRGSAAVNSSRASENKRQEELRRLAERERYERRKILEDLKQQKLEEERELARKELEDRRKRELSMRRRQEESRLWERRKDFAIGTIHREDERERKRRLDAMERRKKRDEVLEAERMASERKRNADLVRRAREIGFDWGRDDRRRRDEDMERIESRKKESYDDSVDRRRRREEYQRFKLANEILRRGTRKTQESMLGVQYNYGRERSNQSLRHSGTDKKNPTWWSEGRKVDDTDSSS